MNERAEKILAFLKETPNDCFLNHALALEYVKAGNDAEARKCFEHNLLIDESYLATYYHLGKLLERLGETESAVATYETGMACAKAAKEMHTYSELLSAHEDLIY